MLELFNKVLNARYIHTENGVDYALERDGKTLYILFECSDGLEDWRKNFDFVAKPYKSMHIPWRCHKGFAGAYKSVRDDILDYVKEYFFDKKIEKIICSGYSHGGALALLCAEDIRYFLGGFCDVECITFGAPRVIWGKIPKDVKMRLKGFKNIRNINDIVTHVPPKIIGFRDAIEIIEIGEKGKYGKIDAHRPESYQKELKRLK